MNEGLQPVGRPVPGWTPRPWPARTPMVGRTLTAEPLDAARHGPALWRALGAAELWTYIPDGPFAGYDAFAAWLARTAGRPDWVPFALVPAGDGPQGIASFMRLDPDHGVGEIGCIVLGPALQRTAAATEATFLFGRRLFDELGYRRFEWKCDACNLPSRRAAERFGFAFEGVFHQHMVIKGRNRDTTWFAITDADWPSRRAAFEAWLDPANFDGLGRQKRSLARFRGG